MIVDPSEIDALTNLLMQRLECNAEESSKRRELDERCMALCGSSSVTLAQELSDAPQNAAATAMEMRADPKRTKKPTEISTVSVAELAAPPLPPRWQTKTLHMMTAYSLQ